MYYFLAVLLFFSSHLLHGAQKKFRPFFDKEQDIISVAYDMAPSPYIRVAAMQIATNNNTSHDYVGGYTLNPAHPSKENIYWVQLSRQDAQSLFVTLEKEYARYSELLHARQKKKEKTCIKEEDRQMRTTKYTQTKNGIKRSATRMLMKNGIEFFDADETEETNTNPEELYHALEKIYLAENPR